MHALIIDPAAGLRTGAKVTCRRLGSADEALPDTRGPTLWR